MKLITPLCILLGTCLIAGAQGNPDKPGKPHRKGPPPPEMLKKFDKDGDGKLSDEERKAMREAMQERNKEKFKKFDKDGDGKLSDEERKAMREAHKAEWIKKFDKDGDGKLSEEERKAIPRRPERPVRPAGPKDPNAKGRDFKPKGRKLGIPENPPAQVE
jgi:uncharacterized membrane protein